MSKSVLCSRNFLGTNFSVHGCNLGRTLCKQTPEQSKETSEKPKRSPLLWEYPEYPDYPTPVRRNWQNKNPTEEQFRYMNARKQELENAKSFEEIPKLPMIPFFGSSWMYFRGIGKFLGLFFINSLFNNCEMLSHFMNKLAFNIIANPQLLLVVSRPLLFQLKHR